MNERANSSSKSDYTKWQRRKSTFPFSFTLNRIGSRYMCSTQHLPLTMGVWVRSWSRNCPHCINIKVNSELGRLMSAIRASLTVLGEGSLDTWLLGEFWPRGREMPVKRMQIKTLLCQCTLAFASNLVLRWHSFGMNLASDYQYVSRLAKNRAWFAIDSYLNLRRLRNDI